MRREIRYIQNLHLVGISNFVVLCEDGLSSKSSNDVSFHCIKKFLSLSVTKFLRL